MNFRFFSLTLLLALALGGPWAWFHVGVSQPPAYLELRPQSQLPGFRFAPEEFTPTVIEALATTNLMGGSFTNREQRFTVFAADWNGRDPRQMSVVQHTPDVCWVNIGWRPVMDQAPRQFTLQLGTNQLPFECRLFQVPQGGAREVVLWLTLLSGVPLAEDDRFSVNVGGGDRSYQDSQSRSRRAGQFLTVLGNRVPSVGRKQFVRFSTRASSDLQKDLRDLAEFAGHWLEFGEAQR